MATTFVCFVAAMTALLSGKNKSTTLTILVWLAFIYSAFGA